MIHACTPLHDVEGLLLGDDVINVTGQERILVHKPALDASDDGGLGLAEPRHIL